MMFLGPEVVLRSVQIHLPLFIIFIRKKIKVMCFIKSNNNKVSTTGQIEDTCDPTTQKQPLKTTAYYKSGALCHTEYNVTYITWQS